MREREGGRIGTAQARARCRTLSLCPLQPPLPPLSQVLLAPGASERLGLPLAAFITPAAHDRVEVHAGADASAPPPSPPPIITQRPPVTCAACGAAACHLSAAAPDGRGWACGLCGQAHTLSPGDALRLGPVQAWPELDPAGADFFVEDGAGGDSEGGHGHAAGRSSPSSPSSSPSLRPPPAVAAVLVVDAAPGAAAAAGLRAEVAAALAAAPPGLRVGLVLAGRAVGVVDAAAAAAWAAAAGGDDADPATTPAAVAAALPGSAGEPADALVRPLLRTALACMPAGPPGAAAAVAAAVAAPLVGEPGVGGLVPPARPRCLGPAIAVALSILEAAMEGGGGVRRRRRRKRKRKRRRESGAGGAPARPGRPAAGTAAAARPAPRPSSWARSSW